MMTLIAASSTLHAWTPGAADLAPTSGFSVDTSSRNDVVSFWHGAYVPSDFYWERMEWDGSYSSTAAGAEGTLADAFVADVERRVNFVRALCGVPANISMNTDSTVLIESGDFHVPAASTKKRDAIQRSALMVALGNTSSALSHNPSSALTGWTVAAWNSNNKSTISKGLFGPGAVDAYFLEDVAGISNWNYDVGHRRWLLAVPVTDMATGDTPGSFDSSTSAIVQPSNLIYVKPKDEELTSDAPRYVCYPGEGFFPVGLNSPFWSISKGGADFSSATVSMTDDSGTPVPISVVSRKTGYAENAIVWSVPGSVRSQTAPIDRSYHVTVSNIGGASSDSHSWSVSLIDPDRLTDPLDLSGPETPISSAETEYQFTPVPGCDQMETGFFLREDAGWEETAEIGTDALIIDRSDPSYDLLSTQTQSAPGHPGNYYSQGTKAFHLTFPRAYDPRLNSIADEVFELDRQIVAGPSASVDFQFRRGYMTLTTALACESSSDGGLTWQTVGSPLTGVANGQADTEFSSVSLPLAESGIPVRLRFRLYRIDPVAAIYDLERYPAYATGAFIDQLRVEGCNWLKPSGLVETESTVGVVEFGASSTTLPIASGQEWVLRLRPVMGGHAFPWGPVKTVYPVGPLGLSGSAEPPSSGSTYTFLPDPAAESHLFEVSRFGPASWSEGAEAEPAPEVVDDTAANYELVSSRSGYQASGESSFRLAVQASDGEDHFEINREVVATGSSELEFWIRRGWSPNQQIDAEVSIDGGSSWNSVWSLDGRNFGEAGGAFHQVDLSSFAGESIRCRFVLRSSGSVNFNANNSGIWVDEVALSDAEEVFASASTPVPAGAKVVVLDPDTAGELLEEGAIYRLRMVPVTDGISGTPGPALYVTPSAAVLTGYAAWLAYEQPTITGGFEESDGADGVANGIKYAFGIDPATSGILDDNVVVDPGFLVLERPLDSLRDGVAYDAEYSDDLDQWTTTGVSVTHFDGILRAVVELPVDSGFLRWKITEE